jgi:hypothetical protein
MSTTTSTRRSRRFDGFSFGALGVSLVLAGAIVAGVGRTAAAAPEIDTDPFELIFSVVNGQTTAAKTITLENAGTSPLEVSTLALMGTHAAHFQLVSPPSTPFTIAVGSTANVSVRFAPTIVGALEGFLRIASDDPDDPTRDVGLYGLSAQGLEGNNEPPLHRVVTTLGHAIDVGGTSLSLGTGAAPIGDEVAVPVFEKANAGSVRMVPVARYSPAFVLRFGYYFPNGASPIKHEVGQLSGSSNPPEHQTLFPAQISGSTTFDPGTQAFGVYTTGPTHSAYSQDSLNTLLHPTRVAHAVRVYPLKDRSGTPIANAYFIGFEEASNGDYQDYDFTLYNVRPVGTGTDGDGDGHIPPLDCDDTNDTVFPQAPELCDGLDNDCDELVDEGNPGSGSACDTGAPGACAAGTTECESGSLVCVPDAEPGTETCNGIDDDCDGTVDEGNPGGGGPCTTGLGGLCEAGTIQCQLGELTCEAVSAAQPESCNGVDDDCDGTVDEGDPGGGGPCDTGLPGVCSAGTLRCLDASLACTDGVSPGLEICGNGIDENCDGVIDEIGECLLCLPESTVESSTQTKSNTIKRRETPGSDRIVVKGSFVAVEPGSAPDLEDLILRLENAAGVYYEATLPAGALDKAKNGRRFSYKATGEPFVHDGLRQVKLVVSSDLVTLRYTFKADALSLSEFSEAQAKTSVKLGERCYRDADDECISKADGKLTRCR